MTTDQTAINRANAQHSTGPRSIVGKRHSSLNAITHGLTSQSPVLPDEDPAAFNTHTQELFNECRIKGPSNRIPFLERDLLMLSATLPADSVNVDIPDLQACLAVEEALRRQERSLANLSMHGHRLSRQFHKTLDKLRDIQTVRRESEKRDLKRAAAILELDSLRPSRRWLRFLKCASRGTPPATNSCNSKSPNRIHPLPRTPRVQKGGQSLILFVSFNMAHQQFLWRRLVTTLVQIGFSKRRQKKATYPASQLWGKSG